MARIKIRIGDGEIEVDSRDFYVDNQSIGQVIADISKHLTANLALDTTSEDAKPAEPNLPHLKLLDDAEVHEPEFVNPVWIEGHEVTAKLEELEKAAFFVKPRTVSETVGQLREYGWIASPLEVSKTLTKMAFSRKLTKDSQNNRNYYSKNKDLLAS